MTLWFLLCLMLIGYESGPVDTENEKRNYTKLQKLWLGKSVSTPVPSLEFLKCSGPWKCLDIVLISRL